MCRNARKSLNAQTVIGQKLRGADITLGALSECLGWHRNTLDAYFPASRDKVPTKLPKGALWDVLECPDFPENCKALLMPDGLMVVAAPDSIDLDDLARRCREFLARKDEAHGENSPAGRDLSECETADLIQLSAHVTAAGGRS